MTITTVEHVTINSDIYSDLEQLSVNHVHYYQCPFSDLKHFLINSESCSEYMNISIKCELQ